MADTTAAPRRVTPATIALGLAGIIALVAVVVAARRSGDEMPAGAQTASAAAPAAEAVDPAAAIRAARDQLARDPDNHEGWSYLGQLYRGAGDHQQAEAAFRRAFELQPTNSVYASYRAEALLLLGSDAGRDEARRLLRRALELDRNNAMARFYQATLRDHEGDARGAVEDLLALLRSAPADAPWFEHVRTQTQELARRRNIELADRLPPPREGSAATAAIPGPTQAQMEAARGIPPSEQREMVKRMVDGLAARLQSNPRDERGWMMLMRSRMVQGEEQAAAEALRAGLAAFADDTAAQQRLRTAAAELGLPGG